MEHMLLIACIYPYHDVKRRKTRLESISQTRPYLYPKTCRIITIIKHLLMHPSLILRPLQPTTIRTVLATNAISIHIFRRKKGNILNTVCTIGAILTPFTPLATRAILALTAIIAVGAVPTASAVRIASAIATVRAIWKSVSWDS
jgi:hypothetical protein